MEDSLPTKFKIVIGLLALVGLISIWSWVDGGMAKRADLVLGTIHLLLAVGLILKFNFARIITMAASVGGALIYLVSSLMFGVWGVAMNSGEQRMQDILAGEDVSSEAEQAASGVIDVIQTLPWLVVVEGVVFIIIYSWIFYYLTTGEALGVFGKKASN